MTPAEFAAFHRDLFEKYHAFGRKLVEQGLVLPALDYCLKSSHVFNLLDASGGIGVTERTNYILRVRQLAVAIAKAHVELGQTQLGTSLEANKPAPAAKEKPAKTAEAGR
jgi:glycyl-tRNA synthetase alpha subunit